MLMFTLAISCLTHLKRPWCWERSRAGEEGCDRGRDGWMASLTQWTCVWASPGRWEGQGSLACCSPCGRKESDTTDPLNNSSQGFLPQFPWLHHNFLRLSWGGRRNGAVSLPIWNAASWGMSCLCPSYLPFSIIWYWCPTSLLWGCDVRVLEV